MLSTLDFSSRLLLALTLGAGIGIERQWHQRVAGLRTNTLVSLGAAIFITLAVKIGGDASGRVASYIVSGIGFLGAGVIMKDGTSVRGLNTAATLWCSAAIGALSGMGFFAEAIIAATFIILAHLVLRPVGLKLGNYSFFPKSESAQTEYLISIKCKELVENHIRVLLLQHLGNHEKLMLRALTSSDNGDPANAIITAELLAVGNQDELMEKMVSRLTIEAEVMRVSWELTGQQSEL
ncbi:MgtC/SapB family protein [Pedobacter gandavensis]|uniref:MgtC/SapB family protein n=1 Tax=Pedobacter gandavensis TaxID=2679963 RepID=UPI00292E656A|nr:MgtC/SapB family protein [Pedobacter gandavensis]